MYTIRFIFESQEEIDIEFAQHYTVDELRKTYDYETRTYLDFPSKVTHIEVYRFEELIFEFSTTHMVGIFDTITIIYNKIKRDEEYCKSLYQQMTDYFVHGKMYQGD